MVGIRLWVISIVLAGFAFSGVAVALARYWFARHTRALLAALPAALVASAALGDWAAAGNPFNPLQLQNSATVWPQLGNIGLYYVVLLPFFALAGLFISLCFVAEPARLGRVYAVDLTGAGCGALVVLALMALVHPFRLAAGLLLPLAAAGALVGSRRGFAAAMVALLGGEALLLGFNPAAINDFKAIYAPLHVEGSRVLAEQRARAASTTYWTTSPNASTPMCPTTRRCWACRVRPPRSAYIATATASPLCPGRARSMWATRPPPWRRCPTRCCRIPGCCWPALPAGFRIAEARALGAMSVDASETEDRLRQTLLHGWGSLSPWPADPAIRIIADAPLTLARSREYDLVDLSGDLLDAGEANVGSFTVEAIAADLRATGPTGLVSVPVSIREFPAYATRMLATVRAALMAAGIADPQRHVLAYRSAWNLRILASLAPFDPARIAAVRAWCDARSFDVSYYPGIDVAAARAGLYNDLPAVSFADASVTSGDGPHDAVADEAGTALRGEATASSESFDLSPVTLDRPTLNAVLRLSGLGTILRRLELLPQGEVAPLVNVAVLAQAMLLALLVLLVPFAAGRRFGPGAHLRRAAAYFASLGLGFLMIEIAAIEAAALLLTDRTWAFALVLTAMLVFSGLGSLLSARIRLWPAVAMILVWCAVMLAALPGGLVAAMAWPFAARATLIVVALAPVSVALGVPFPRGLGRLGSGGALPWAWALNGAFSVVATPLANLIAIEQGHARVLQAAIVLYCLAALTFPRVEVPCPPSPAASP